jgi:putative Holliday junction resolvase
MTVLAVDYGRKRKGLAVSDPSEIIAMPLDVISAASSREAIDKINAVCADKDVRLIILGFPVNMDGSTGEMAQEASAFGDKLGKRTGIPVERWDERLSSAFAERALLEGDRSRSFRKKVIDKVAAQSILQSYLDSKSGPDQPDIDQMQTDSDSL